MLLTCVTLPHALLYRYLALVCLLREESFSKQGGEKLAPCYINYNMFGSSVGLIDYNFYRFRDAIQKVSLIIW